MEVNGKLVLLDDCIGIGVLEKQALGRSRALTGGIPYTHSK